MQAARADLRRAADRAVDPPGHVDGLERSRRAAPAARPARARTRTQQVTVEGPHGPVTDTVEMIVGRLGMPELGGSYFTFSNENNDLIWGFLAECHRRGWLYKGHDSMPWCTRCGTGISQMEMNEGYQDREDPGLTVRFPLVDRPGECAARLDDHALDADRQRRRGRRAGADVRQGAPGRGRLLAGQGHAQDGAARQVRGARGEAAAATWSAGATAGRSTSCPPCRPPSRRARTTTAARLRAPRRAVGRGRRGRGHGHRPHRARLRRRGLPAGQGARPAGRSRRSTRTATTWPASAG